MDAMDGVSQPSPPNQGSSGSPPPAPVRMEDRASEGASESPARDDVPEELAMAEPPEHSGRTVHLLPWVTGPDLNEVAPLAGRLNGHQEGEEP
jgi:hypothetical protein